MIKGDVEEKCGHIMKKDILPLVIEAFPEITKEGRLKLLQVTISFITHHIFYCRQLKLNAQIFL